MKKSSNAYFIAILVSLGLVLTMVYNAHARSKPGIYINFPIVMLENKSYRDGENLRSLKKTGYLLCLSEKGETRLTTGSVTIRKVDSGIVDNMQAPVFQGCESTEKALYYFTGKVPFRLGNVASVQLPEIVDSESFLSVYAKPDLNLTSESSSSVRRFTLNGETYRIKYVSQKPYTYKVILESASVEQTVISRYDTANGYVGLQWAGDLDGDGKLDLIMSFSDGGDYGNVEYFANNVTVLFLSSFAREGELVSPAARHVASTGC